jgi:uncharacterized protein
MLGFTPYLAIFGGILIGIACGGMMIVLGHIAGNSGIAEELLPPWEEPESLDWRSGFILGLIVGALLYALVYGHMPLADVKISGPLMAVAGLLVGFGTAFGHGCTSGHGVNGIARLSMRSFVATGLFLLFGILSTFTVRHVLGLGV